MLCRYFCHVLYSAFFKFACLEATVVCNLILEERAVPNVPVQVSLIFRPKRMFHVCVQIREKLKNPKFTFQAGVVEDVH